MRRYEPIPSAYQGGTVPSIFGTNLIIDKSLSAKLQKKKDESCKAQYSSNHFSLYQSFCPSYLHYLLSELKGMTPITRMTRSFYGTCLVIDLSGFTRLSAELCDQGASGLDELRKLIHLYIGNFVDIITSFGGDGKVMISHPFDCDVVMYFAGDSLITLFHHKKSDTIESKDIDTISIAIHCANQIHSFCSKNTRLSAHAAIAYGEIQFSIIGGYLNHWVYIVTGKCMTAIGNSLEEAHTHQTVITEAAYLQLADPTIEVERLQSGRYLVLSVPLPFRSRSIFHTFSFPITISSISSPSPSSQSPGDELQSSLQLLKNIKRKSFQSSHVILTESQSMVLASHIVSFLPRPVLEGIALNLLDQLSELRIVTTLFLKVETADFIDACDINSVHHFFYSMQECLADSGGYLRQFLFDDKGCVLLALWGVPTATYANNCSRALRCAVVMSHLAKQSGYIVSIGISTGSVYCGIIGLPNIRQDYVAIGKSVNLAARLMCIAKGRILLDQNTFGYLPLEIATLYMTALPNYDIKGFTHPISIFWYSSNNLPPFVIRDTPADSSLVLEKYITRQLGVINSYLSSLNPVFCSRESGSDIISRCEPLDEHDESTCHDEKTPKSIISEFIPSRTFLFGKRPYFFVIYGCPGFSCFFSIS